MQEFKKGQIWQHKLDRNTVEIVRVDSDNVVYFKCGFTLPSADVLVNDYYCLLEGEKPATEIKQGQVWQHVKTGERVEVDSVSDDGIIFFKCGAYFDDVNDFPMFWELVEEEKEQAISPHYNNDKGSLYQFCEDKQLNSYEFDIIKRVMRCRKKGQFIEDLEKTKFLIDLYIKEYNEK